MSSVRIDGTLRPLAADGEDEVYTFWNNRPLSAASSLSVGSVSGVSSVVRNSVRSMGTLPIAPSFPIAQSSDRHGLQLGFQAVEERFEKLFDGQGLLVAAEQIDQLQSATNTYTELLRGQREQLNYDVRQHSMNRRRKSIDDGFHSSGGSSKVVEAARMGSHNGHSFVGGRSYRPDIRSPLILEDRRDLLDDSVSSMTGMQPLRPCSPSSTTSSSVNRILVNEQQRRRLHDLSDQVRRDVVSQRAPEKQERHSTEPHRPPLRTDRRLDAPVHVDTHSVGRQTFAQMNTGISPIGSAVDGWLQPQFHPSTTYPGQAFSSVPMQQAHLRTVTDGAPPTTSDQATGADLDREDLRKRLTDFRQRITEIGQRRAGMQREQGTSPVHFVQEENKRRRLPITVARANTLPRHSDDVHLKRAPFISAKFVGVSHSVHTNVQELMASLKQQHPALHQLGLRLGVRATVPQMAQAFRDEMNAMLRQAENRLEQLLNEYDRLNEQMKTEMEAAEQDKLVVQLGQLSVAIERQDSTILRLQKRLFQFENALSAAAISLKPSSRMCGQRLQTMPIGHNHVTDHTFSSLQKSVSSPATLVLHADNQQGHLALASNGSRQLRELRLLHDAFAP